MAWRRFLVGAGITGTVAASVLAVSSAGAQASTLAPDVSGLPKSRRFDHIFRAEPHCRGVPVEFLRALAKHESNFNPREQVDPAWGLLQVIEVVREGYNRRFKTSYSRQDLLDPRINTRIVCELVARIARVYRTKHQHAFPNASWSDRRFVELVVFGWNAGYSEAAGTGFVIGQLERAGNRADEISIDTVHSAALEIPRASRHLRNSRKVGWCKGVVRTYFRELAGAVV